MNELHINVLGWEGYDDPIIVQPYSKTGGCTLHVDAHISDFTATQRVLAEPGTWDLVSINSPSCGTFCTKGLIRTLDAARFGTAASYASTRAPFAEFHQLDVAPGGDIIGVCQRFGPFKLVVNTNAVSADTAADQAFDLVADPAFAGRYGSLAYDDFNVFHIAIAAGIDQFTTISEEGFAAFGVTAARWFSGATIVSGDHNRLNHAIVDGEIRKASRRCPAPSCPATRARLSSASCTAMAKRAET